MPKKLLLNPEKQFSYKKLFKSGIISGMGWAIGATIGFAVISTILVFVLKQLGGIPLVGGWIATVVESTLQQLVERTPILPQ